MTGRVAQTIGWRGAPLIALALLLCCRRFEASRVATDEQSPATSNAPIAQRVRALKDAFPDAEVQLDQTESRVAVIERLNSPGQATGAEDIARSVLSTRAVHVALGLSSDLHELCPPVSRNDPQLPNRMVIRMPQCVDGVKVLGAELVMNVRTTPAPAVDTLVSSLVPDVPRSATPKISAASASKTAVDAARSTARGRGAQSPSGAPEIGTPELLIFAPARFQLDGPTRLCWLVRVDDTAVLVDAITGSVVYQYSDLVR